MRTRQHETTIVVAQIERPVEGPVWKPDHSLREFPLSGLPGWQSNGGPTRGHPARSLPFSFEAKLSEEQGQLIRVHILGVFALHANSSAEAFGTLGATVQLLAADREIVSRFDLLNGRHYGDSQDIDGLARVVGDGTSIESIGTIELGGEIHRVDLLTLDVPFGIRPRRLQFKDLGSPASFLIFDVFYEFEGSGDVDLARSGAPSIGELGSAIRVGDRVKFGRAVEQLDHRLDEAENLDEARNQALTFLAVVYAALLETSFGGAQGSLLDAARQLDTLKTRGQIREAMRERVAEATEGYFMPSESASDRLVDRALAIVERHYAKDLTDAMVAAQLGLSTSHFRFLFRQATGHPFHKYVVALRLEKAKQMLIEQELPVSQVAMAVGFTGLSHFSRAFTQRFSASPSHIRRAAG